MSIFKSKKTRGMIIIFIFILILSVIVLTYLNSTKIYLSEQVMLDEKNPLIDGKGFVFDAHNLKKVCEFKTDSMGRYSIYIPFSKDNVNAKYYNIFILSKDGKKIFNNVITVFPNKKIINSFKDYDLGSLVFDVDKQNNIKIDEEFSEMKKYKATAFTIIRVKESADEKLFIKTTYNKELNFTILVDSEILSLSGAYGYGFLNSWSITPIITDDNSIINYKKYFKVYNNVYTFDYNNHIYKILKIEPISYLGGGTYTVESISENKFKFVDMSVLTDFKVPKDYSVEHSCNLKNHQFKLIYENNNIAEITNNMDYLGGD